MHGRLVNLALMSLVMDDLLERNRILRLKVVLTVKALCMNKAEFIRGKGQNQKLKGDHDDYEYACAVNP